MRRIQISRPFSPAASGRFHMYNLLTRFFILSSATRCGLMAVFVTVFVAISASAQVELASVELHGAQKCYFRYFKAFTGFRCQTDRIENREEFGSDDLRFVIGASRMRYLGGDFTGVALGVSDSLGMLPARTYFPSISVGERIKPMAGNWYVTFAIIDSSDQILSSHTFLRPVSLAIRKRTPRERNSPNIFQNGSGSQLVNERIYDQLALRTDTLKTPHFWDAAK